MNKKKILLIDDEQDTLMVVMKQLVVAGYTVITADNGPGGLLLAKSQKPDLIVLDVQMPDMDGGEINFKLKEDPATRDIPVVFSTCLLSDSESYKSGDKIMFAKARDTKELIAAINKILQTNEK